MWAVLSESLLSWLIFDMGVHSGATIPRTPTIRTHPTYSSLQDSGFVLGCPTSLSAQTSLKDCWMFPKIRGT